MAGRRIWWRRYGDGLPWWPAEGPVWFQEGGYLLFNDIGLNRRMSYNDAEVMQQAGAERIITADTDCNCSDLRGSAGYSASCGGATKYRISTASRFRPLKREQLRAKANPQERVT